MRPRVCVLSKNFWKPQRQRKIYMYNLLKLRVDVLYLIWNSVSMFDVTDIGGKILYKCLNNQFAAPYMSKAIEPESIELVNIWTNEP